MSVWMRRGEEEGRRRACDKQIAILDPLFKGDEKPRFENKIKGLRIWLLAATQ